MHYWANFMTRALPRAPQAKSKCSSVNVLSQRKYFCQISMQSNGLCHAEKHMREILAWIRCPPYFWNKFPGFSATKLYLPCLLTTLIGHLLPSQPSVLHLLVQYWSLLNWRNFRFRWGSVEVPVNWILSLFHLILRYLTTLDIVSSLVRRRVTRRLTRFQTMCNVLKYRKVF